MIAIVILALVFGIAYYYRWRRTSVPGLDVAVEKSVDLFIDAVVHGVPGVLESTQERCQRYLQEYGSADNACANIAREKPTLTSRAVSVLSGFFPPASIPVKVLQPLWLQMRDAALIAALHGNDLNSESTRDQLKLYANVDGVPVVERYSAANLATYGVRDATVLVMHGTLLGKILGWLLSWVFPATYLANKTIPRADIVKDKRKLVHDAELMFRTPRRSSRPEGIYSAHHLTNKHRRRS
jgi:hypothetical protein